MPVPMPWTEVRKNHPTLGILRGLFLTVLLQNVQRDLLCSSKTGGHRRWSCSRDHGVRWQVGWFFALGRTFMYLTFKSHGSVLKPSSGTFLGFLLGWNQPPYCFVFFKGLSWVFTRVLEGFWPMWGRITKGLMCGVWDKMVQWCLFLYWVKSSGCCWFLFLEATWTGYSTYIEHRPKQTRGKWPYLFSKKASFLIASHWKTLQKPLKSTKTAFNTNLKTSGFGPRKNRPLGRHQGSKSPSWCSGAQCGSARGEKICFASGWCLSFDYS